MSARLQRFFRIGSWVVMTVAVAATALMVLAIFAMSGGWANRVVAIIPASAMMLTLGFSAGAGLRALVSIDERLSAPQRGS